MSWDIIEEKSLVGLHQATSIKELSQALFSLVRSKLVHQHCFLMLRPLEFELASICSHSRFRPLGDRYIRDGYHRHDIWLKRSPVHPSIKAVRHSDYTPLSLLKRTLFYRHILQPMGSTYGISMVTWRQNLWMATLTIFRSERQNDFTDEELHLVHRWQLHFESAIHRIAHRNEERMQDRAIKVYVTSLPDAVILLDWDLRVINHNHAAGKLCDLWQRGSLASNTILKRAPSRFELPSSLRSLIGSLRPTLEKKKTNRPSPSRVIRLTQNHHQEVPGLWAQISFVPSKTLSYSRGLFLVNIRHDPTGSSHATLPAQMAQLTRQEREVAHRAAQGQTNAEIAVALGKSVNTVKTQLSSVFRKLQIPSKVRLAASLNSLVKS